MAGQAWDDLPASLSSSYLPPTPQFPHSKSTTARTIAYRERSHNPIQVKIVTESLATRT
ncbi:hypothetical protein PGT21_006579 [Puccinia graminis f. sp. tritici]|uniref:Uncharacterized protein n=1 Tax=Puccinia graminis f. sp. tritici TaxID=56615 RepID=A0A5B0N7Y6_PUCGR|nr:hypothetical protein PGT21_006579 [Puccinia graminis f. sp. tritici]